MSTDIAPVVVAADGTDRSEGAVRYAVQEAHSRGVGLAVVHVLPSSAPTSPLVAMPDTLSALNEVEGRRVLAAVAAAVAADFPDIVVDTALGQGSRSNAIVAAAGSAGLLVLGRESRAGLERLTAGATTEKVAARALCPVVVVPPDWHPAPREHRLAVGVRSASESAELVAQAFEMAAARDDSLTVVHVWRLPDPYPDRIESQTNTEHWRAEGERMLQHVLEPWIQRRPEVPVSTRVVRGDPVAALVQAGEEADLVVIARRSPGQVHLSRLGTTARALLRHATVPVMVLPPSRPAVPDLELETSGRHRR